MNKGSARSRKGESRGGYEAQGLPYGELFCLEGLPY